MQRVSGLEMATEMAEKRIEHKPAKGIPFRRSERVLAAIFSK